MHRRKPKLLPLSLCSLLGLAALAAEFRPPAADRPAVRRPGAESVLPGGRLISPLGQQYPTGPGPFGLALSPDGETLVTADGGPNRYSLTVLHREGAGWRTNTLQADPRGQGDPNDDDGDWRSVFQGLAFSGDRELYASEGNSGRVRLVDVRSGSLKQLYDLNTGGYRNSYTGDLALDPRRGLLYVLDQANFRLAVIDTKKKRITASLRTGRLPFAIALSPDSRRVYVTHVGMFEYKVIPGADPKRARETGLPMPAFGFPSPEARDGARRQTASGMVDVPGLGDPNARESNSLAIVDVADPAAPKLINIVRTGKPFGGAIMGGASPSGVVATADRVFVSNANQDTITVLNARTLQLERDIELRVPGLESLRGMLPIGLHYEPTNQWILAAEAGINALAVIDARSLAVLGHIPTAWFPTRATTRDGRLFVASAKGHGTGPNAERQGPIRGSFQGELRRGAVSILPLPGPDELTALTRRVWANNGFTPARDAAAPPLPADLDHVVIIVKENRTFDEVFGDLESAANGPVEALPPLARFGKRGVIVQQRTELRQRLGLRFVNITPNHHAIAERFAFSDNFYADSEVSVDGHHWIVGSYPNAWTESTLMAAYGGQKDFRFPPPDDPASAPGRLLFPQSNSSVHPEEQLEAGALWHHLERHNIGFRNFGEGFELAGIDEGKGLKPTGARVLTNVPMPAPLFRNTSFDYPGYNMNIPDQFRANQFINEIDRDYLRAGKPLPRLIFIHLPGDHMTRPRPEDGYPFQASYVADNDHALGRIVQFLSQTPYWKRMAILVTEDDAQGGVDHIDSHRTVFLAASPWAKKNYCSHANSSFPALLKLAFRILRIPPLNLYDATAADLGHIFTDTPDFTPYNLEPSTLEVFDPSKAREPMDPQPSPRMDDPRVLREQHRQQQP